MNRRLEMLLGIVVSKSPQLWIISALKTVGFEGGPCLVVSYQKANLCSTEYRLGERREIDVRADHALHCEQHELMVAKQHNEVNTALFEAQ